MSKGLTGSYTFQDDNGIDEHHVVIYKCCPGYECTKIYGVELRSVPKEDSDDYAFDDYRLRKEKKFINGEPIVSVLGSETEKQGEQGEQGEQEQEPEELMKSDQDIYIGLSQAQIRKIERRRRRN